MLFISSYIIIIIYEQEQRVGSWEVPDKYYSVPGIIITLTSRPVFWFSNMFILKASILSWKCFWKASILIFQYLFWRPVFWFDVYFEFWWFQAGEVPVGLLRPRCPLHHHIMVFTIVKRFKPWPHHPQEDHGYCHPLQVLLPPAPRLLPCSHCSPCHRLPLPGKDWDVPHLDPDPDSNFYLDQIILVVNGHA